MRLRSILLTSFGVLAGAFVFAVPANAGTVTVTPSMSGAGTISASDGYGCLLPPANVNPKNTDTQGCTPKAATGTFVVILGTFFPRNGVVALTATPRTGWRFIEWQGCVSRPTATCTSSVTPLDDDYATTPKAVFREIVPVQIDAKPPAFTADSTPTFGFSTPVGGATIACAVDGGAVPCSGSAVTLSTLTEGSHTFKVTAIHNTNLSLEPASYSFVVDTVAPQTSFDVASGPGEGALQTTTAETFKLASNEPAGATFECSLDGAAFTPCDATVPLTGLASGGHTFEARAIDRAGNVDGTAVRRSWTIAIPDADNDGFNATTDCNDANPAVFPGRVEVPDNGVDENCDGADALTPPAVVAPNIGPAAPEQLIVTVAFFASASKKSTKFSTLQVKNVPLGATVTAVCKGKGCPSGLKGKGFTKKNAFGTVTLAKFIKKAFKVGDTITVVVSKPNAINAVKIVKVRAAKKPLITTRCQPPGAKKPVAC